MIDIGFKISGHIYDNKIGDNGMEKGFRLFRNDGKAYKKLASVNCMAISEYNENILSALTLIGGLLMLLPVVAAPFSKTKSNAIPAYLLASTFFFICFFIFKLSFMKKYTIGGLYICASVFFSLAIYLSVFHSPNMRATILLGAFCIIPLGFIDRPWRMNLFIVFWMVVHTVSANTIGPESGMIFSQ